MHAPFIWLRDKHGIAQITILKTSTDPTIVKATDTLGREDVIAVEGTPIKNRIAKVGAEIAPIRIELISKAETPLPLDISGKEKKPISTHV